MANGEIVFYGTAAIGLPILTALHNHFRLTLIITQPDSRGGRHRQAIIPAVKQYAHKNNLALIQPRSLSEPGLEATIGRHHPLIAVAVAYGQFIPRRLYTLPRFRTVNVHFSLLPSYRGAAPVQRAIENGDQSSGITIFEINARMDAGDIWAQKQVPILPDDTSGSFQQRLGELAAPFLLQTMKDIFSAKICKRPQNDALATSAPALQKSQGRVDWNLPAQHIVNKLRAFTPWPGLFFNLGKRQIKIVSAATVRQSHQVAAGTVLSLDQRGLHVACGQSSVLEISSIQPEAKKAMTARQYSLGNRLPERLQ
ncbi:MAG: methionyl-tRNA formyltransferase [Candidatus Aminicenantes bacterium]|nr:methionyl-tRNA formyltransferase [Candidatus Aminicenantes bacterium]